MSFPEIRYARSGDAYIAYQVLGHAPLDLVFVTGFVSHLDYFWDAPLSVRFPPRLASFSRLIMLGQAGNWALGPGGRMSRPSSNVWTTCGR